MGEETPIRRKAIPLAIFGCVVFAGLFYVVVSMAESMGFGTGRGGRQGVHVLGQPDGRPGQDVRELGHRAT